MEWELAQGAVRGESKGPVQRPCGRREHGKLGLRSGRGWVLS